MNQGLSQGLKSVAQGAPPVTSSRVYPVDGTEWTAAFPAITTPSAIWPMQDASAPAADGIGANGMVNTGCVFNSTGEDDRVGVLFDANTDGLEVASALALDPDGATSMTYWARVYIPAAPTASYCIFSKRAGADLPGFEIYVHTDGLIRATQDGGASGRQDFQGAEDHRGGWHDIAYVIDRSGAGEGRIETDLEAASFALTGITSLSSTMGFALGVNLNTGRFSVVDMVASYAAAWDGAALTRPEFLEIWGQS